MLVLVAGLLRMHAWRRWNSCEPGVRLESRVQRTCRDEELGAFEGSAWTAHGRQAARRGCHVVTHTPGYSSREQVAATEGLGRHLHVPGRHVTAGVGMLVCRWAGHGRPW